MGIVGGYSMDVYCDHPEHDGVPVKLYVYQYYGETRAQCVREARNAGWRLSPKKKSRNELGNGFALCPHHSGKKKAAAKARELGNRKDGA